MIETKKIIAILLALVMSVMSAARGEDIAGNENAECSKEMNLGEEESLNDLEFTYDNVTETIWPIEHWIKQPVLVKNNGTCSLNISFAARVVDTWSEVSAFPQPYALYLNPGESQIMWIPLDSSHLNLSLDIEANYTKTVLIQFWLKNDSYPSPNNPPPVTRNITLNYTIRILPSSWYQNRSNAKIYGYIYDKATNQPLEATKIALDGIFLQYSSFTNESGYYEINFYAHRNVMTNQISPYVLFIPFEEGNPVAKGYEAFSKPLWPVSGDVIRQDVYLEKTKENVTATLLKRVETNMSVYRGAVTKDERYVVFSHGHPELDISDEEVRNRSSVLLFDTNGTLLWKYTPYGQIWGVDISEDGAYIAAAIIDTGTLANDRAVLLDHNGSVLWDTLSLGSIGSREIKISHNSKYVAWGAGDGDLYLFNITNGNVIWKQFIKGQIRQVLFSSDDSRVFAGSGDGNLYIVDINGTILSCTNIEAWPYSTGGMKLSKDDAYVATASKLGNITLVNATNGEKLWAFDTVGGANSVDISPNNDYVIAGSGGAIPCALFDINGTIRWWQSGYDTKSVMISNDGNHIVIGRDWGIDIINPKGTALWNYWEDFSYIPNPVETHFVYINKNQTRVITGHGSGAVYFWDLSIRETEKPEILNIQAIPSIQEVNGYVNITAFVSDNAMVNDVYVNIMYPNGTLLGNFSMNGVGLDANKNGTYYYNMSYSVLGSYSYYIWANDTSNNQNKSSVSQFQIYAPNPPPTAYIDSITPNPATQEASVTFVGHGDDTDGTITAYNWRSSIDGQLSTAASFSTSTLSVGTHAIYFKVQDNNGTWSDEVSEILVVNPAGGGEDTAPPEITDVQAVPETQMIDGYVNIICTVTDNVGVNIVKVNITYPDGETENITMMLVGENNYSCNASYSDLGSYSYYIWADDINNNQNKSATYTFSIRDNTKPVITNVQAAPASQTVGGYVNITCTVTDNVAVNRVYTNVTYPPAGGGILVVCTPMIKIPGTNNYYYNTNYSLKGTYDYYIWANDTSNNAEISQSYQFYITSASDTEKSHISNVEAMPQTQTAEEYAINFVNISCTITDNVAVNVVKVHIAFPDDTSPVNATMTKLIGTNNYYYIFIYNTTWPIIGTYSYYIWANDTANNQNISTVYTFEIYTSNLAPVAVTLNSPVDITATTMQLSWSQNTDSDFANYTIYQSTVSGDIGTAIYIATALSTTSYTVAGLSQSTTYYFRVRIYDTGGLYNDSSQVSGTTSAAVTTGNLTGTITDKNNKPIEGVTVSILGTSYKTGTDSNGRYTFTGVSASSYQVRAEKSGYKTKTETGIVINAGVTTALNIVLEEEKKEEPKGFIPGFETATFLAGMIGVCIILLRRKKNL